MKLNPDAPNVMEILREMVRSDALPDKVGGGASDAERLDAHDALVRIVSAGGVRVQCIGCDEGVMPDDAAMCECGGFVCPACRALEDEGVCNHETPAFLPADDSND